MQVRQVRKLTTGSIFKLIFFGSWVGSIPVFFGIGALASTGIRFITWNGQYITGWHALIGGPLFGLFLSSMFGLVVASLTALGHRLISKFGGLKLYCEIDEDPLRHDA